jgi:hypothetical protein
VKQRDFFRKNGQKAGEKERLILRGLNAGFGG